MRFKKLAAAGILACSALGFAPLAAAAPPYTGCQSDRWEFLGSGWRVLCDGPVRADGSWERDRLEFVPAHYVPSSGYCGSYSCSFSGGYNAAENDTDSETYVVFPDNVLPDEPGHLVNNLRPIR